MTNELLKLIPLFRERPRHLLVCATNAIHSLDSAFVRPGRFDYLIPVGPPDAVARGAIWRGYVARITDREIDLDRLVKASEFFTPADIDFAARKAAQVAFERSLFEQDSGRASMDDFLGEIAETRPSLTRPAIRDFEEDIDNFTRL